MTTPAPQPNPLAGATASTTGSALVTTVTTPHMSAAATAGARAARAASLAASAAASPPRITATTSPTSTSQLEPTLAWSTLRAVRWRVHLGACTLPQRDDAVSLFIERITAQRQAWQQRRDQYCNMELEAKHYADVAAKRLANDKPVTNALHPDDAKAGIDCDVPTTFIWNRSFPENMPVLKCVRRDIERTFGSIPFFKANATRCLMERILYIWLVEQELDTRDPNKDVLSYRQGMNELLGVILIALLEDRTTHVPPDAPDAALQLFMTDDTYLEHDAAVLFEHLMKMCLPNFTAAARAEQPPAVAAAATTTSPKRRLRSPLHRRRSSQAKKIAAMTPTESPLRNVSHEAAMAAAGKAVPIPEDVPTNNKEEEEEDDDDDDDTTELPKRVEQPFLYRRIFRIHHVILRRLDPGLYSHLRDADVIPQLYLLRWIRVLFSREFSVQQVLRVWDSLIISHMALVDYLCVAMVGAMRAKLFATPTPQILASLMRYPPPSDAQTQLLIRLAHKLRVLDEWIEADAGNAVVAPDTATGSRAEVTAPDQDVLSAATSFGSKLGEKIGGLFSTLRGAN